MESQSVAYARGVASGGRGLLEGGNTALILLHAHVRGSYVNACEKDRCDRFVFVV